MPKSMRSTKFRYTPLPSHNRVPTSSYGSHCFWVFRWGKRYYMTNGTGWPAHSYPWPRSVRCPPVFARIVRGFKFPREIELEKLT